MSLGSVAKASETLNLTQPALSKQIAALEQTVALKLFERRRGGPMTPTREGRLFYKSIESTLFGLDSIAHMARDIAETGNRQLTIVGTPPILNSRPFTEALAATCAQFPNLRCGLELRARIDVENLLISRQADVGFGLMTTGYQELHEVAIADSCVMVAMAPSHPLANKQFIKMSDLADFNIILPSRQPLRDRINAELSDVSKVFEVSSSLTGCNMAAAGIGVALSDPFSPTSFDASVLKTIPLKPKIELTYGAFLPPTTQQNDHLQTLIHHFKKLSSTV
jgi:DNA-binding transcriptional LysR family regulator